MGGPGANSVRKEPGVDRLRSEHCISRLDVARFSMEMKAREFKISRLRGPQRVRLMPHFVAHLQYL